jgi:hypothetical protein
MENEQSDKVLDCTPVTLRNGVCIGSNVVIRRLPGSVRRNPPAGLFALVDY